MRSARSLPPGRWRGPVRLRQRVPPRRARQRLLPLQRACSSSLLLLGLFLPARDPPGHLDVWLVRLDREAAALELGAQADAAVRLEVAQFVLERRQEPTGAGRQPDRRVTASVGPDLAVEGGDLRCRPFEWTSHGATVAGRGKTAGTVG